MNKSKYVWVSRVASAILVAMFFYFAVWVYTQVLAAELSHNVHGGYRDHAQCINVQRIINHAPPCE